jgi:hypothetical protein
MSSTPLQSLWDASASQPFTPTISKEQQFTVGFTLLFAALVLTGLFGMSMWRATPSHLHIMILTRLQTTASKTCPCLLFLHL